LSHQREKSFVIHRPEGHRHTLPTLGTFPRG
jgi:hypothetical protein